VYDGDGAGDSLDRTREGYVEIIEMGPLKDGSATAVAVTHVNGTPKCDKIDDANATASLDTTPTGGLFGGMTVINVRAGEEFTQDAVALAAFRQTGAYVTPGNIKPDLQDADPVAIVFDGSNGNPTSGTAITANMNSGVDAVSAVLMHDHLLNEFVLDANTNSGTDWVVTMPTKRYYFDAQGDVQGLFQRNFTADGACDDVSIGLFDREEFVAKGGFSPPPTTKTNSLCWEATVITFNNTNVLGSENGVNVPTTFPNGWMNLGIGPVAGQFGGTAHVLTGLDATFTGLPTIGFSAITFNNGTLSGPGGLGLVQSNYGGAFKHRATVSVVPD
jgi:hypothetical protein